MDIVFSIIALIVGGGIGAAGVKFLLPKKVNEGEEVELASTKAQNILLKAKDKAQKVAHEASKRALDREKELDKQELRLSQRKQGVNQRSEAVSRQEDRIEHKLSSIEQSKRALTTARDKIKEAAAKVAGMTKEEAKNRLMRETEEELKDEVAVKIRAARAEWEKNIDDESKQLLVSAMETAATDYVEHMTTSTVKIENEDIKGRVIGREGRNIKAFEKATGVEVIVDEAPDYITMSCFDPVRREIARIAMAGLVSDGRIHPGRIEDYVKKARRDVAKEIVKAGEDLAYKAGFPNLPMKHIKFLGKFKYRYSYGQNLASHTLEIVKIVGRLAKELGLDVKLAKKCALFHDLGKVAPNAQDGSHTELGVQLGKKLGLEPHVLNAMQSHHQEIEPSCMEAALVYIGDAISGARPGARRTSTEAYYERITELEEVAKEYEGVKEVYAIFAGRELRVLVDPEKIDDAAAEKLARDIAKKIEKTQTYAGTVQVTLIRETRTHETAK